MVCPPRQCIDEVIQLLEPRARAKRLVLRHDIVRQALEDQNPMAIKAAAHSLKSSSASVGATRVAESAKTLEQAGSRSDPSAAAELLETLAAAYQAAAASLDPYQQGRG
jgi:HPt (histidine-containing phosphotransfer) domain-containing protein